MPVNFLERQDNACSVVRGRPVCYDKTSEGRRKKQKGAWKMQIGQVIRHYRKMKHMTQEELAKRLGVTAPAVNKWENGNSLPDITLLAPIARLLDITPDTLLSFREELTEEEIEQIIYELDSKGQQEPYEDVFLWAKKKLEQYPNSDSLLWQIATVLDARRLIQKVPDSEKYDDYLCSCYVRALQNKDKSIRNKAADSLFCFYRRKQEYEKAETYLEYFSEQDPERKRKQAELYRETNRVWEAYQTYEELLLDDYRRASAALHGMYLLAESENDRKRARMLAEKQGELARCFEMGMFYEASAKLGIAVAEKNAELTEEVMKEMLSGLEQINGFCNSPLYEHMTFREPRAEFWEEQKQNLLKCFREEEQFGFLQEKITEKPEA